MSKNYISFVNDHSGSMYTLSTAAMKDYNANIKAVKDAATREMLDTVVSVAEVGGNSDVLPVVVSNPHVLHQKTSWRASGGTPLWGTTAKLLDMLKNLPDAHKDDVSFLVMITTDGEATDYHNLQSLRSQMLPLHNTGRWTFVARVPSDCRPEYRTNLISLGIPEGNIQEWDTTTEGMAKSTVQTTQAMDSYFTARSAGAKSSNTFYANAAQVDTKALTDVTSKISLYVVPQQDEGIQIRDFVLTKRMEYLKGAAFYQLTKTEARVSHTKLILVRDRTTGKFYAGRDARQMIGLPTDRNARLHPGDHKNYDLFIQSESVNRKLVGGTGLAYWEEIGVRFTEADLAYLKPKVDNGVVQLPAVPVSTTPTKSPIPVQKKKDNSIFSGPFRTREEARKWCRVNGYPLKNIYSTGVYQWHVALTK